MRLIFCGTPRFAVPTLERLVKEGHSIELVVTNPDEPSGRGQELKPPPVKEAAHRLQLLVFQPAKFKDRRTQTFLTSFKPEAMVVVAFGHIFPKWALEIPQFGCFNLHASILPRLRGAAPIPWSIIRRESETGVTTMKMDDGMDTGSVLLQRREPIMESDTAASLSERLSEIGADLMAQTLRGIESGEITPRDQEESLATHAPMIRKEDGRIDWQMKAAEIERRVRGFNPWPGAFTGFRGKTLHIWKALPGAKVPAGAAPGTIELGRTEISVVCGEGTSLRLEEIQIQGKKRMPAADFARGARIEPGEKLGD